MSSPQPIGVLEMHAYVSMKGIKREDDIDFLIRVIPILDDVWLEDWHRRNTKT